MSRATKRHASRKAKEMSSEELVIDIREMEDEIPKMPTHEFDDKRAIHKKRTRIDVYKEVLKEREDALVLGDFVITAKKAAERIAPYGDVSNGIRSSKPDDNGLIQYVWRMSRFHSGDDHHMPVTAFWWLQSFLDSEGIDASVSGIHDDAGKDVMDKLEGFITVIIRNVFEIDDTAAARRWKKAGLF